MNVAEIHAVFPPGQLVATPALTQKVPPHYAFACLGLHLTGNWGLVCEEDWDANDRALKDGSRLLSVYALPEEAGEFWIITEAADENGHREATTLLLPEDY